MLKLKIVLLTSLLIVSSCFIVKNDKEAISKQEANKNVNCKDTILKLQQINEICKKQQVSLSMKASAATDEIKKLKKLNKNLNLAIDSSRIDTLSLFGTIDSLHQENKNINFQKDKLNKQFVKLSKEKYQASFTKLIKKINKSDILSKRITFKKQSFDIFVVDVKTYKTELLWHDSSGNIYSSLDNVKNAIQKNNKKLLFATNAGMYTPNNSPEGLYIENFKEIVPINLKQPAGYLNFYMNFGYEKRTNGVFTINAKNEVSIIKAKEYKTDSLIKYATQSGPLMVCKNQINPFFNEESKNKKLRSGVGIIDESKIIFIISNGEVNFFNFATLFRDVFNCENALYLDGVISRTYLPAISRNQLGGSFGAMFAVFE